VSLFKRVLAAYVEAVREPLTAEEEKEWEAYSVGTASTDALTKLVKPVETEAARIAGDELPDDLAGSTG
jgi:hypothetical protein